ncbi:hypothetical protein [Acinetobacter soli]|uniref:hypothetical protein n=1 Tax=Acinetobacter soli TaxID=487316 RepID=UPI00125E6CF5|nr:hypothetical protein [Acinetobacter soli]
MTIEKLTEFAKDTDAKNLDGLTQNLGFPAKLQPARQWFNWLFNALTKKVNESIDAINDLGNDKVNYTDIVDNLTSTDEDKPLSANMGRELNEKKLSKSDLASGSAPIYSVRAWANFAGNDASIRAQGNIESITRSGVGTYNVVFAINMEDANYSVTTAQAGRGDATSLAASNLTPSGFLLRANYGGDNTQGGYDPTDCFFQVVR